jgi:succinate dehydrogenase / fumarate reductase cytochrome b subunit
MMNEQQFINLNLFTIKFPLTAIVSIAHRLSGILIFLLIPLLLALLDISLNSQQGFNQVQSLMENAVVKLALWLLFIALLYHLMAGIRHLLMDIGIGENLKASRWSSKIIIGIFLILALLMGIWLW